MDSAFRLAKMMTPQKQRGETVVFCTVATVSPLTVVVDGDTDAVPAVAGCSGITTGARVVALHAGRQVVAIGVVGGGVIPAPTFHYIGESGEPAFENSWANVGLTYVPARYWLDALATVHVQAALKSGTDDTAAFTVPVGFRPDYDCYFPASAGTAGAGRVLVQQSGVVRVNRGPSATVMFHVTFPAA